MELFLTRREKKIYVALLDDRQRIVRPVYDYLQHLRVSGCSMNTLKTYGGALKTFWAFLAEKDYDYKDVDPRIIGEFIEILLQPGPSIQAAGLRALRAGMNVESSRSNKTVNRILGIVKLFYRYTSRMERGIENPIIMSEVTRPFDMYKGLLHHTRSTNKVGRSIFRLKESKDTIRVLDEHQKNTILNSLPTRRDRLLFKLLRDTGMRIGEALSLHIEDIPTPKRTAEIGTIVVTPREENKPDQQPKSGMRSVIVPMDLLFELDTYILEQRSGIPTEHSYLFVVQHGKSWGRPLSYRAIWEVFNRVSKNTGIDFHFHDLRHTYCSELVEAGIPLPVIKDLAGHKNIATTQLYTHVSNKFRDDSIKDFYAGRRFGVSDADEDMQCPPDGPAEDS